MKAATIVPTKRRKAVVELVPPQTKIRKMKKSVRFSTRCQVVTVTISGHERTWYEKREYSAFRVCNKEDVIAYAKAKKNPMLMVDGDRHSLMGLESYIPPTKKIEIEQKKKQRVHAVLSQQLMQRINGAMDPEALAYLAEFLSKPSCDSAVERARSDADENLTVPNSLAMWNVV